MLHSEVGEESDSNGVRRGLGTVVSGQLRAAVSAKSVAVLRDLDVVTGAVHVLGVCADLQ